MQFLLSGLNSEYVAEWDNIYISILNVISTMCFARKQKHEALLLPTIGKL